MTKRRPPIQFLLRRIPRVKSDRRRTFHRQFAVADFAPGVGRHGTVFADDVLAGGANLEFTPFDAPVFLVFVEPGPTVAEFAFELILKQDALARGVAGARRG